MANPASYYTEDELFIDCTSRYISDAGGRFVLTNHLLDNKTYSGVWGALVSWMELSMSEGYSVVIPRFFSIYFRVYNMGISIPNFELHTKFAQTYNLTQNKSISTAISKKVCSSTCERHFTSHRTPSFPFYP